MADILMRSGAKDSIAGTKLGTIIGFRDVMIVVDESLNNINIDDSDLIVLPGGQSEMEIRK